MVGAKIRIEDAKVGRLALHSLLAKEDGCTSYLDEKVDVVMLPCLPAKSPAWHVCGFAGSQG